MKRRPARHGRARHRPARHGLAPLLAAAALLAGCANLPVGSDGLDLAQRRARLEAVESWEMRGRLAVATGDRSFQGSYRWRHTDGTLELTVRGPLGAGVLEVSGSTGALTVTARGDTRVLADPETQLSELLGWWLPVGSLHAWLLGFPDPSFDAATQAGSDGTLASFDQRLWHVEYPTYQLAPDGGDPAMLVPRRIDLTHEELRLRLTIDDWHALQ
jgi:outer membrane lipoprotein LolB